MDDTRPKPFVFVLMPFSEDFGDVYELGIKAACAAAGAYCERVDEQMFDESILQRVYNQISKADIIVADMTGRNANVFYETGYAHALNKRVILLTQKNSDIPFDLQHYPHIIYGAKITTLRTGLEKKILWCIENPKESLASADMTLTFCSNGQPIGDGRLVEGRRSRHTVYVQLDIHNPSPRIMPLDAIGLSLITPRHIVLDRAFPHIGTCAHLPDGRRITNLQVPHAIFPEGWESIKVAFKDQQRENGALSFPLTVRVFTPLGHTDFEATVTAPREDDLP